MKAEEIDGLLPNNLREEFATAFLAEFLKDGFGAASKRSTELHVFHLLERLGTLDSLDNSRVSHLLQITESRVKSYRYESKLRFPPSEEKYIQRRILWCLAMSEFDHDSKRIRFIVEDPYVRKTLAAESKRLGGVPDTSFNSEIVVLRIDQLHELIEKLYGKETAKNYKKEFESLVKQDTRVTFAEVRKNFVLGAAKAIGASTVTALKAYFTGGAA